MPLSIRAALGSRWASRPLGLLLLLIPSVLLTIAAEVVYAGTTPASIVTSVIAQHLGVLIPLAIVEVARRNRAAPIPLWASISLWTAMAVIRGVVGGLVLQGMTGAEPAFLERIVVWLLTMLLWMPVAVYSAAQIDARRALLDELELATRVRDVERSRADTSIKELSDQLLATVQETVVPVIAELRSSLGALTGRLDPEELRSIGDRIAAVTEDAAHIVDGAALPTGGIRLPTPAPLGAALRFVGSSPALVAVMTSVLLGPLALVIAIPEGGWPFAVATVAALIAVSGALVLLLELLDRFTADRGTRLRFVTIGAFAAGSLGALVFLGLSGARPGSAGMMLAALIPFGVTFCASVTSVAGGIARSNRELENRIEGVRADTRALAESAKDIEVRVREQVRALLHGPVIGRLSACAMALNFHAAGPAVGSHSGTSAITDAVVSHLDSASNDLAAMGAGSVR